MTEEGLEQRRGRALAFNRTGDLSLQMGDVIGKKKGTFYFFAETANRKLLTRVYIAKTRHWKK